MVLTMAQTAMQICKANRYRVSMTILGNARDSPRPRWPMSAVWCGTLRNCPRSLFTSAWRRIAPRAPKPKF